MATTGKNGAKKHGRRIPSVGEVAAQGLDLERLADVIWEKLRPAVEGFTMATVEKLHSLPNSKYANDIGLNSAGYYPPPPVGNVHQLAATPTKATEPLDELKSSISLIDSRISELRTVYEQMHQTQTALSQATPGSPQHFSLLDTLSFQSKAYLEAAFRLRVSAFGQ